ncbi:VWA domain-containing protein [Streptomyces sp. NPDC014724]|uniref:vWA domain-containing protein n=1 Tax=unclassified Streptomyces TaxID=2593676 RepID=UPI00370282FE
MVLDSSGSMADDDGTGRTRMESARTAVGTVVDGLPDGYPTGLRVYGADRPRGCADTRLVQPVHGLDRAAVKRAVAAAEPKGDTPIGLSLRKAAEDLPRPAGGAIGTRTILLISDGEDNCGTPRPCEVAAELGREGIGLRIDTVDGRWSSFTGWGAPLDKGVTPAGSRPEYGDGGKDAVPPTGDPRDVRGGRYEYRSHVRPVHAAGGCFYVSVTLGAGAADIAENPQIGVVLRVSVLGDELTGPEHNAPVAAKKVDKGGNPTRAADSGGTGGAGWTGIVAAAGAGAVVVVMAGLVVLRGRRGRAAQTTRGSA